MGKKGPIFNLFFLTLHDRQRDSLINLGVQMKGTDELACNLTQQLRKYLAALLN